MQPSDITTAFQDYLASDGREDANPHSLPPGEAAKQVLVERLERAFQAGAQFGAETVEKDLSRLHEIVS